MTTQKKKNKERHKQDIHKTYKSHETYGKHPSSLVLNETHVKCLRKIIFKPRIFHSTNLSFRCEGKIKIVSHIQEISKITLVKYWIFFSPHVPALSQKTTRR